MDRDREHQFYGWGSATPNNKNTRSYVNSVAGPSLPKDRYDFKIAIICALPLEASAVCALFDQRWDDQIYGKAPNDSNSYSTGMIGHHNVVLVHMPNIGKVAGATAATSLHASFPEIHLALVVGICGGVPGKQPSRNILLGDVVISEGLVQYDLGRQYSSKRFVRKDTPRDNLPRASPQIRAALSKLKTEQEQSWLHNKTSEYLWILQKRLGDVGIYPGAAEDRLFKSAYRHKHHGLTDCATCANERDDVCDMAIEMSCEELQCDEQELVPHTQSQVSRSRPIVHFGLIASGDAVMKSGEDRDEIATRDGIIAFEMEGAGVWDHFHSSVVIKGICDYADSHKNKKWQGYAAATAAAVSKVFLESWVIEPSHNTLPYPSPTTLPYPPPTTLPYSPPTTLPSKPISPTPVPRVATAPPPGDYDCGNPKLLVCTGKWTKVEIQICLRISLSRASVVLKLRKGQYRLGRGVKIWCYSGPKHPMHWTVSGSVWSVGDHSGGGGREYSAKGLTASPDSEDVVGELDNITSGKYAVSVNYSQVGPYWKEDATIRYSDTFTIIIP